ncbi:MAG: hypothetical protein CMF61_01755 [Magnetococcales bacterium]|nr:hypothetical protein [Magnetococcales bacterium]
MIKKTTFKYGTLARQLIPTARTVHSKIKKANTRSEAESVLNMSLFSLLQMISQMQSLKDEESSLGNEKGQECMFFETALICAGLAVRFMQMRVVTPENKPELLKLTAGVYEHLKKSAKTIE